MGRAKDVLPPEYPVAVSFRYRFIVFKDYISIHILAPGFFVNVSVF
jgi:hypothetical protein